MRSVDLAGDSQRAWDSSDEAILDSQSREVLQAYADGVNDYVQGVSLFSSSKTARLLPPEFLVFGITKESFEPWTPVDSIITIKMMSLLLTWDWAANLQREGLRQKHPDLNNLMEEIMPFTTDFLYDVVPIVDDSDLKKQGLYSEEPLVKRYR